MATIFTRIIKGEIPAHCVAESDEFFAFLDINPVQDAHTLVIPKREEDYIFDLTDDELARMMVFSKIVAKAIKQVTGCIKVGVTIIGLEVPHAHIHLVPMTELGSMNFSCKKTTTAEELSTWALRLRKHIPAEYQPK